MSLWRGRSAGYRRRDMGRADPRGSAAYFGLVRSATGAGLDSAHYDDFQRLVKTIGHGSPAQLLLVEYDDVAYRKHVIELVDAVARDV